MGSRGWRGGGYQFPTRLHKALGGFGERKAKQRNPRGENDVESGRDQRLMLAINLAQSTLGPVALDGIAHGGTGGNHTYPRIGRRAGRTRAPSEKKDAAVDAAPLFSDSAEVGVAPQALTGGQSHGWARGVGHAGI